MSRRNRLTWDDEGRSDREDRRRRRRRKTRASDDEGPRRRSRRTSSHRSPKTSERHKSADPYEMNQDPERRREQDYMYGDPSAWAEEPHEPLPNDDELGRNAVGMPRLPESNYSHRGVDEWHNENKPYDNAFTFSDEDLRGPQEGRQVDPNERNARADDRETSQRQADAHIKGKAYHCVKIAEALLPNASEAEIEEQAYDLLQLPDKSVVATSARLDEFGQVLSEDDEEEDDEDEDVEEKIEEEVEEEVEEQMDDEQDEDENDGESDKDADVDQMLNEMMSNDASEPATTSPTQAQADGQSETDRMLREMMSENAPGEQRQVSQEQQAHERIQELNTGTPSGENVADIDMDVGLPSDQAGEAHASQTPADHDLGGNGLGNLNLNDGGSPSQGASPEIQEDEKLQQIFAQKVPEEAEEGHKAQPSTTQGDTRRRQGVSSLGGQMTTKEAKAGEDDLSKLWDRAPDVSDYFS